MRRSAVSAVDAAFHAEWPRLVATLTRELRDLELAEDAVQEAFVEASRRWRTDGPPRAPGAWLLTTARRKAIDVIRRDRRFGEQKVAPQPPGADDGSIGGDPDLEGHRAFDTRLDRLPGILGIHVEGLLGQSVPGRGGVPVLHDAPHRGGIQGDHGRLRHHLDRVLHLEIQCILLPVAIRRAHFVGLPHPEFPVHLVRPRDVLRNPVELLGGSEPVRHLGLLGERIE